MRIFNAKDAMLLDVEVDDTSYRHRVIKGEHNIVLKYSLPEHVELPVGSYCFFQGQRYTLESPEAFKKQHNRRFDYTVTFESYQSKARIWKFRNPVDGRLKFSLTANPKEHLQMFVDNMNRRDTGWTVGECIDGVEKLINYDHDFCIDALTRQASEFKTEYEIEGKRVSLKKVEYDKNNPLPLSYGYGNGFKSGVGRSNSSDQPPTEILFVQGGSDNIDRSKYGNGELLLPKGQTIRYDGEHFEGEDGFNAANARTYVVDDLGLSIRRADKEVSSLAEDSIDCSEIYPKRVGTISSVVVEDEGNNLYDIIDNSIPSDLNYEDYLIEGETMTIIFQSGMLAGKEFDVKYIHDAKGGKKARRFEIVPQEVDGETMPNSIFAPKVGDTYAVFNCYLPASYICDNATKSGAEWDMFRAAVRHLFDAEEQKYSFTGELDGLWAKKDWENIGGKIRLGGYVLFRDENFQQEGVLVRITGIKDYINKPHSPSIELSNQTVSDSISGELKTLKSEEVTVEENYRSAVRFTKRRFRDAQETISMLEASLLDNFTNSISPIAVQTMMMLVGDESLQFRFVASKTNLTAVGDGITYDNTAKQLHIPHGFIQHMTLGIGTISSSHADSEYKVWEMNEYLSPYLDNGEKKYYLYAKVSRTNTSAKGDFLLSDRAIKMTDVAGYYHLLIGILNSEYDGERSYVSLYGFSEILPGRITTDRIATSDGKSFIDFLRNALHLGSDSSYLDWNNIVADTLSTINMLLENATIKTKLSVLGEALIAGFLFSDERIRSLMMSGDEYALLLDGNSGRIKLVSDQTGGDYSMDTGEPCEIDINAGSGVIETRNNNGVAYVSASGVFCNNPKTNALPSTTGRKHYGAIVGIGNGNVNGANNIVAGVYGRVNNTGNSPAYGGYFQNLMAEGLILNTAYINGTTTYLGDQYTQCVGLIMSGTATVYLPTGTLEGNVIFAMQIGKGLMRFRPQSDQKIYSGMSEIEYFDISEGWEAKFTFVRFTLNGEDKEVWFASRWKN